MFQTLSVIRTVAAVEENSSWTRRTHGKRKQSCAVIPVHSALKFRRLLDTFGNSASFGQFLNSFFFVWTKHRFLQEESFLNHTEDLRYSG